MQILEQQFARPYLPTGKMFVAAVSRTPLTPITKVAAMEDTTEGIPLQGSGEADVLGALGRKLEGDLSFSGERILGSMCTLPHPTSAKVYEHYLDRNIGDPGLHPRLQQLERETIGMLGRLLGSRSAEGAIVTGGTEANLIALWAAKRKHRENGRWYFPKVPISRSTRPPTSWTLIFVRFRWRMTAGSI